MVAEGAAVDAEGEVVAVEDVAARREATETEERSEKQKPTRQLLQREDHQSGRYRLSQPPKRPNWKTDLLLLHHEDG